jgi:cobalt-zinc-cadmium efflux system protein
VSRIQRLTTVLLLNLGLVTALVIVGLAAHSLAVLAAGADYLADAGAIGVSLLAIWLASRPPSRARPDGYPNATNIAALVNAGWLLALNVAIAVAAIQRLAAGARHVEGLPVLIVSGIAAAVMLAGALVLGADAGDDDGGGEDLNVKAVLLDTAADAAAAGGVAASGAIILAVGRWYWLDPAVALVIAVIITYHAQNSSARSSPRCGHHDRRDPARRRSDTAPGAATADLASPIRGRAKPSCRGSAPGCRRPQQPGPAQIRQPAPYRDPGTPAGPDQPRAAPGYGARREHVPPAAARHEPR